MKSSIENKIKENKDKQVEGRGGEEQEDRKLENGEVERRGIER
jgi:hypothetical protein